MNHPLPVRSKLCLCLTLACLAQPVGSQPQGNPTSPVSATTATMDAAPEPIRLSPMQIFSNAFGQMQQGQLQSAVDLFTEGLAADPGNIEAWLYLGQAQTNLGQEDLARSSYNRALSLAATQLATEKAALARTVDLTAKINNSLSRITPLQLTWLAPMRLSIAPGAIQGMEQNPALRAGRTGLAYRFTMEQQAFEEQPGSQCTVPASGSASGRAVTTRLVTRTIGVIDPPFVYGTATQEGASCQKKDSWTSTGDSAFFAIHGLLADANRSALSWACSLEKCRATGPVNTTASLGLDQLAMSKALGSVGINEDSDINYVGSATINGNRQPRSISARCTLKAISDPRRYQLTLPGRLREFDCQNREASVSPASPSSFKMLFSDALQADLYALGIVANPGDTRTTVVKSEGRLGSPGDRLTVTSSHAQSPNAWTIKTVTIEQPAQPGGSAD